METSSAVSPPARRFAREEKEKEKEKKKNSKLLALEGRQSLGVRKDIASPRRALSSATTTPWALARTCHLHITVIVLFIPVLVVFSLRFRQRFRLGFPLSRRGAIGGSSLRAALAGAPDDTGGGR